MDILDFLRYYKNIKICFVTIFVFSGLHKNKNKLVCQAQHFNFYKIKFGSNAWIERTQLKKNSVAFRFGKKCTYTYIVLAIDTLSRVWLQKLEFTQFSEISSRPGKRLYRMSEKNVSIWIFKINVWNTQHFRIYFALCVSTTLCCCTLTFRNIHFKVYDILKCQNFLISFLDEFGNFKQKNFTFQNVKFFLHFIATDNYNN